MPTPTRTLFLGRLALHIGMQARDDGHSEKPWMGFAYGSWWPRVRVIRGLRYVPGVFVYWLCFHASADLWDWPVGWGLR